MSLDQMLLMGGLDGIVGGGTKAGFVIAGQSNSLGYQDPSEWDATKDATNSSIYMYSYGGTRDHYDPGDEGDIILASDHAISKWNISAAEPPGGVGFWLSALKNYVLNNPGVEVCMIHAGDAGTGFRPVGTSPDENWNPDELTANLTTKSVTLFDNLVDATQLLEAAGYPVAALLWHQAEYNGYNGLSDVYGHDGLFLEMVHRWRQECFSGALKPVVIGTQNGERVDTVDTNTVYRQQVEADQLNVQAFVPQAACCDNTATLISDTYDSGTHFNANAFRGSDGVSGMGLRYYNAYASISASSYSGTPTETNPTLVGSPSSTTAGPLSGDGNALTFDSSGTQYAHADISGLSLDFGATFAGWIKPTVTEPVSPGGFADFDTTTNRISLQFNSSTNTRVLTLGVGTETQTTGDPITFGSWLPFIMSTGTYNGTTYAWLYLKDNYRPRSYTSIASPEWSVNTDILIIGRLRGGSNNASDLVGAVAHYAVWNQSNALNAQERYDFLNATTRSQIQSIISQTNASLYLPMCDAA